MSHTDTPVITRFAPSPTGRLHIGHAYSALVAHDAARQAGGRFLIRIEDIDTTRCRPEFEAAILDDLAWLGLEWEKPVRRQSEHMDDYAAALDRLGAQGLLYPCFCTRREIAASTTAPHGPEGPVYPGTCRGMAASERHSRMDNGDAYALRLNMDAALARAPRPILWHDRAAGPVTATPELFGDVVLARKETPTSYHLAVTVDDALQGITLVTRGHDLFDATHIHRLLQVLLDLPMPDYHHHPLLVDETGRRLAKRDRDATLAEMRARGVTPDSLRARIDSHRRAAFTVTDC
ncbi:MAG: tRNA glutamyl-Q(34) synthetase GluQRS [Sphingomonadales bacterium]